MTTVGPSVALKRTAGGTYLAERASMVRCFLIICSRIMATIAKP